MPLPEVQFPEIATLRLPDGTKAAVRELTPAGVPVADSYRRALDEWIERQRDRATRVAAAKIRRDK